MVKKEWNLVNVVFEWPLTNVHHHQLGKEEEEGKKWCKTQNGNLKVVLSLGISSFILFSHDVPTYNVGYGNSFENFSEGFWNTKKWKAKTKDFSYQQNSGPCTGIKIQNKSIYSRGKKDRSPYNRALEIVGSMGSFELMDFRNFLNSTNSYSEERVQG